jgi:hypothetical protein
MNESKRRHDYFSQNYVPLLDTDTYTGNFCAVLFYLHKADGDFGWHSSFPIVGPLVKLRFTLVYLEANDNQGHPGNFVISMLLYTLRSKPGF